MGEMEADQKDPVMKLFENFVQASACKGTLQAFNVMCTELGLDPLAHESFYSSLKDKVTTWKAKALWSKLDKRMAHKEYKKGQACVGTKVKYWCCCLFNSTHIDMTPRTHVYIAQVFLDLGAVAVSL